MAHVLIARVSYDVLIANVLIARVDCTIFQNSAKARNSVSIMEFSFSIHLQCTVRQKPNKQKFFFKKKEKYETFSYIAFDCVSL